jgi:DNA polymerase bacteriophage-type
MATYVVLDKETFSCADLNKVGAWRYAEDPSTGILCIGFKVVTDGVPAPTRVITEAQIIAKDPELLALVLDESVIFVAHNAGFEQAIWKHVMVAQFGWPELPPHRWHDTMAVAARMTLPMALGKVGEVLNLRVQKDFEGHRTMMQMCKPGRDGNFDHSPEKLKRLIQYNVGDVDSQYELHKVLGGLGASERKVWIQDQIANQRGIMVDVPYVRQCMDLLEKARGPLEAEFKAITGINPTQRAKILEWIQAQGVAMTDMRKATLDAMLDPENDADAVDDLPALVHKVISIRRMLASSSVAKLGRMIETMNFDGRIRGTMQYHGARTGRNAGRLVQPLNMPKPLFAKDKHPQRQIMDDVRSGDLSIINAKYGNAYDAVISTLRGCFRPGHGKMFAAGDFNAIEARVVLALAGQHEVAKSFDAEKYSKDDPYVKAGMLVGKDRDGGKAIFLSCGFGISPKGYNLKAAPGETLEFCERAVSTYRKQLAPLVPKLWYGLEKASADAVWCNSKKAYEFRGVRYQMRNEYLVCTLPSGREMYYFRPQREQGSKPWKPEEIVPAWSYLSFQGKRAKRQWMWYGLATENVVQATARDIMIEAMFRAEAEGLPMVFTVYDELVTEPPASRTDAAIVLGQCMEERSDWVKQFNIPIRAECELMQEYQK